MRYHFDINDNIFNPVYTHLFDKQNHWQIVFGGASSGKSFFQAQRTVIDCLRGHNYLVVRKYARSIRNSVFAEIRNAIASLNVPPSLYEINSSFMTITFKNNCQILFTGLDDVEKVKSIRPKKGVLDTVWIEEATEVNQEEVVLQLEKRMRGMTKFNKRIILTFNPVSRNHWIYKKFFEYRAGRQHNWKDNSKTLETEDVYILKTTYRDNKFLTQDDISLMEKTDNPYMRKVYVEGNFATLGNIIYPQYTLKPFDELYRLVDPDDLSYGLDFGFGQGAQPGKEHPAAVTVSYNDLRRNRIIVLHGEYIYNALNDTLASYLEELAPGALWIADSARPDNIADLRRRGIAIAPAQKGPDSVLRGINYIQQRQLLVAEDQEAIINELDNYSWMEDKDGNTLPKPEKAFDDCLDALRYSINYNLVSPATTPRPFMNKSLSL